MSFNIKRLSVTPQPGMSYFLDANIWIYSMQEVDDLRANEKTYSRFFYNIIESEEEFPPKIIMPLLLWSEIINTYMRKIAFLEHKKAEGITESDSFDFKRDYRPTQHCREKFEYVHNELQGYAPSVILLNDTGILNRSIYDHSLSNDLDFNDTLYYRMCIEFQKSKRIAFITNDSDFKVPDIPILTLNSSLLSPSF